MIRTTAVIHCDHCYNQFGPTFCSEYHAQCWTEDRDDDYEEYGQFAVGVPRFGDIFHKAGPNPTPLEKLLVERIALCWINTKGD